MSALRSLASTRLARGTAAGFYGQGAQLVIQLVSVPVLSARWGLAGYGVWLILFTIPSMLVLADLGLTTAGANSMTAAVARGERAQAAQLYRALRLTTLLAGLAIAGAVALAIAVRPGTLGFAQAITGGHAELTVMLLTGYGLLALANGVSLAALRAADAYASSGVVFHTVGLLEAGAALVAALAGGSPLAAAASYLAVRALGTLALAEMVRRRARWLHGGGWLAHPRALREVARPALAALVLPIGNAITLQGAVMAIGATGGPAAVPAFTTVRTLSRTLLQFAFRLNVASMPRYTVLDALGDERGKARLVLVNLLTAALLLLPAALPLLAFGIPFIRLWTGGVIEPPFALLALMVAAMLLNGAWVPLSNLILAVNRHDRFTYAYAALAAACVGFGAVLATRWGGTGMAAALVILELAMTWWIWRLARAIGVLDPPLLAAAWRAATARLRPDRPAKDAQP